MKKIIFLFSIAVMIITACQPKTKTVPVDTAAVKIAVNTLLDMYNSAMKGKDANTMAILISDDAMICGTDPSEFWGKKQFVDEWAKVASDTSIKINYTVDRREIKIASDGNSAVVIEQFILNLLSPKIQTRIIYHVIKAGDNWIIDLVSWNFIPKNEDIAKLNKALE